MEIVKEGFCTNYPQATTACLTCWEQTIILTAVYCHPIHLIFKEIFSFFSSLGQIFLVASHYNTKHSHWESKLINHKGKQLYDALIPSKNNIHYISPAERTQYLVDLSKEPDIIGLITGINQVNIRTSRTGTLFCAFFSTIDISERTTITSNITTVNLPPYY